MLVEAQIEVTDEISTALWLLPSGALLEIISSQPLD